MRGTIPYNEAPVWAQQEMGRPVSLPVEGMKQIYAFAVYRDVFAQLSLAYQKHALILSPPGIFLRVGQHTAPDETREGVRAIASSHGVVVIEGPHSWGSTSTALKTHASFHFHDKRNERAAFAR